MTTMRYLSPQDFARRGEGVVNFGTAPDGLPWITPVAAPPKGAALLAAAQHVFSLRGALPDFAGTPLHEIALSLDDLIRHHYTQDIHTPDGAVFRATILPRPVHSLVGDSIFQRLLRSVSDPTVPTVQRNTGTMGAATNPPDAGEPSVPQFQTGEACLAFPDEGRLLCIVHMTHDRFGWPSFTFRRPFVQETLKALAGGRLCSLDDSQPVAELAVADTKSYLERRRDSNGRTWVLRVPRASLGTRVAEVVEATRRLHSSGEIHGDIKPANVLLAADGVHLIDSLRLHEGNRSSALTRGWAAPEQVMAAEVSPATDQFPLGLMLLALVQGVLFGEETTIVVPSGGAKTERHALFRSPGVFIDPDAGTVGREHLRSWQKLIERCLRFSPADRFPAIGDLLAEIERLLAQESLLGSCEFPLRFGRPVFAIAGNGEEIPGWLAGAG